MGEWARNLYLSSFFDLGLALCVLEQVERCVSQFPRKILAVGVLEGLLLVGFVTVYCGAGCGPLEGRLAGVSHTL